MSKLKECPSCGKEVAKSAKVCPSCGKKLKMGLFLKLIIAGLIAAVLAAVFGPSKEEQAQQLADKLQSIQEASADNLSPRGELAALYKYGSDYTDLQRDDKEKELKGKIVEWNLPVYEVSKSRDTYRIQTNNKGGYVGTFTYINVRSDDEESYIKQLKTGDMVHIKGKITDITGRNINIKDAILMSH